MVIYILKTLLCAAVLFLFIKAIILNHKYLADNAVVNTFQNTESYRLLLFNKVK